jgi:tRNA A-37 threonylcarbamoyl transferase component Bud32
MNEIDLLREIDSLLDSFDEAWNREPPPSISDYLSKAPAARRYECALELAFIDLERRLALHHPLELSRYTEEIAELAERKAEVIPQLEVRVARWIRGSTTRHASTQAEVPSNSTFPVDAPARFANRYALLDKLAEGGEAVVYLCWDSNLKRTVALKWMKPNEGQRHIEPSRFLAQKDHLLKLEGIPNVVRVLDCGITDECPWIVTDFIQGRTLDDHVQNLAGSPENSKPPVSPRDAVRLLIPLIQTVDRVHRVNITHQDIKPRNVILDSSNRLVLIDFGLAWVRSHWKESSPSDDIAGGTPQFIAPEQAKLLLSISSPSEDRHEIHPKADIFGLGCLLLFMLTGEGPYVSRPSAIDSLKEASEASGERIAQLLDAKTVPRSLQRICCKALAFQPHDRYESAEAFAIALKEWEHPRFPRPWHWIAALVLMVTMAVVGNYVTRPAEAPIPIGLEIRVLHPVKKEFVPLQTVLPLQSGNVIQVRFQIPGEYYASLFSVNGQGRIALLEQYPAEPRPRTVVWPTQRYGITIEPPEGTEFLFVCTRKGEPVSADEIQAQRMIRVLPDTLKHEGETTRDFGARVDVTKIEPVEQRLERFRTRLREKYPNFEGLTFRHD